MEELKNLIQAQKKRLLFYSTYNFLRSVPEEEHFNYLFKKFNPWFTEQAHYLLYSSGSIVFFYQYLPWDSTYFRTPTYKLFTVLYPEGNYRGLIAAASGFRSYLKKSNNGYCFADIPAEDIFLIQALNESGFRLTETRLTYYKDNVQEFTHPRFEIRKATLHDIPSLRKVAAEARNDFDRYHADTSFAATIADEYLSTYAEACVKGLAQEVIVPDKAGQEPQAFLAISNLTEDSEYFNTPLSRVLLTAVGPASKGWHIKLVAETVQYAKNRQGNYVLMTTQATNRAVFRTSEKLGFKLGSTTHILATTF